MNLSIKELVNYAELFFMTRKCMYQFFPILDDDIGMWNVMMHEAKIGDPHLGRNFLGDSPSQIICHLLDLQKGNVFEKKVSCRWWYWCHIQS